MKYTHIGLGDQAKALSKLKGVSVEQSQDGDSGNPLTRSSEKCPRPGHAQVDSACQTVATGGNGKSLPQNDETPAGDRGYRENASSDNVCQKWRRRESNPRPVISPCGPLRA